MKEIKDKIYYVLNNPGEFSHPEMILKYLYARLDIMENSI